ncbi:hypothetical protein H8L32_23035 [Undibacterium sp. CY18W]|uniref:Tail protein n=1 Tax=Undibacterium hunanense TaxID=2762292 RepID=A0ABR6ZWV4_9BURK|nr:hypothetical protein [Undibacterium hunanense]MBC3920357.1 hypothetical protein [Undibacterium hunanense]
MSAYLSVLAPINIDDAILVSSTAAENDYPLYSNATTYAVGTRCISTTTHRIYESVRASNLNNDPTNITNRTGTTPWWIDIGPTNKWAMFDGIVSTQTSIASPLTVVLRPGAFNSFFLGGIEAETIAITVRSTPGGTIVYSYSGVLEGTAPDDYYEYFFDRFKPQTDFVGRDIGEYNSAEISITLTRVSGSVKLGLLAIGDLRPLGMTQYGARAKPKTYSYIKVDEFGNNVIKRRKAATDMSATAVLELSEANTVLDILQSVLDVPCVWICTDIVAYQGLRVFGLGSGEISYDHPTNCQLTLNVQGLI